MSWQEKVGKLREELKKNEFDATVITALDEIAWLFNLRGNDVPYNPVFRAYAVVDMNQVLLYLPHSKQSINVKRHLKSEVSTFISLFLIFFMTQYFFNPSILRSDLFEKINKKHPTRTRQLTYLIR